MFIPGVTAQRLYPAPSGGTIPAWKEAAVEVTSGTDYVHTSTLAGATDGPEGTFSMWVYKPTTTSKYQRYFHSARIGGVGGWVVLVQSYSYGSGAILYVRKADNSKYAFSRDISLSPSETGWFHLIWSWKTSPSLTIRSYKNGVANGITRSDNTPDTTDWSNFGDVYIPNNAYSLTNTMRMADVYLTNEYIDLNVSTNLQKFISGGCPVNLGDDGSLPTGNQPIVYFSGDASVWNNAQNRGYQTGWTSSGGFTDATSPCGV